MPSLSDPSGPNMLFRVSPPLARDSPVCSFSLRLSLFLPSPWQPARDPPIPPSPSAPRDIVTVALCLSLSLSHVSPARSFTDISLPLFSTPSLPLSPGSLFRVKKRSTFCLRRSFLFLTLFSLALITVLFPISLLFLPTSSLSLLSLRLYPLPIGIRASLSVTRRNSLSLALALHRGPLSQPGPHSPTSLPPSPHLSRRLASPAFPLRHLPRAILPPSTRLAHPAVVSLRYSPFCPRGTSNAEAQVCKMAAVCWSLNATKTLLCFDESEEDAMRKREGEGEEERKRERERQVSERGRRRKQKNEGKR